MNKTMRSIFRSKHKKEEQTMRLDHESVPNVKGSSNYHRLVDRGLFAWMEGLLRTVAMYIELMGMLFGIDMTWRVYAERRSSNHVDDDDDDGNDDSWTGRKATRIENCLGWYSEAQEPGNFGTTFAAKMGGGTGPHDGDGAFDGRGRCPPAEIDLWELRELALSGGGLLKARYRQQAWPRLVGLTEEDVPELANCKRNEMKEEEKVVVFVGGLDVDDLSTRSLSYNHGSASSSLGLVDEEQLLDEEKKAETIDASVDMIRRDVGRSVVFRYNVLGNDGSQRGGKDVADDATTGSGATSYSVTPFYASQRLARVLEDTIRDGGPTWHYYQGLHDIAGVILHNMNYQTGPATQILKRISHSHLRDAMRENFGNISWLLSVVLPPLVEQVEPNVHRILQWAQVDLENIVLPWLITWFTHDLHDPETAGRLVDAFLSGHPLMPMYFAVALITHPILKLDVLDADCEDQGSIFLLIKKMPLSLRRIKASNDPATGEEQSPPAVSMQEVLDDTLSIMNRFPPRALLDLVGLEYNSEYNSRSELLQRASSISLFKAPASWSIACGSMPSFMTGISRLDSSSSNHVRAKLASGVPMLMATVGNSSILTSSTWGSRRYHPTKKKTKKKYTSTRMKRLVRVLLGKEKFKVS